MQALKSSILNVARRLGYDVIKRPTGGSGAHTHYETVRPLATYSPWNRDEGFLSAYAAVQERTLVDLYRCYELWSLVGQCAKLPGGALIEVGVWRGGTGALIARRALGCGIAEPVYLCDTFRGVVKAGAGDGLYQGGEHADTSRASVQAWIERLDLTNVQILEGVFPDDSSGRVAHDSLRFCHIDVDVYQSARDVTEWAWPRLRPGGVIVYDDYGFYGCSGVTQWVEEQIQARDRLVLHNLNGHAVVVKLG